MRISASSIRYTPAMGFSGTDSFRYEITDGREGLALATATWAQKSNTVLARYSLALRFRANVRSEKGRRISACCRFFQLIGIERSQPPRQPYLRPVSLRSSRVALKAWGSGGVSTLSSAWPAINLRPPRPRSCRSAVWSRGHEEVHPVAPR